MEQQRGTTRWYTDSDPETNESWFVNAVTLESAWVIPPSGVEIGRWPGRTNA